MMCDKRFTSDSSSKIILVQVSFIIFPMTFKTKKNNQNCKCTSYNRHKNKKIKQNEIINDSITHN